MKGLTVSQLARLGGVSVRTLHHYDEIGLLQPCGRASNGYRLYERSQLPRLQQILFFRELELPLEEICRIMNDPAFDLLAALLQQRQALEGKAVHLRAVIDTLDAAITSLKETTMNAPHENEAQQRWGHTPQWKESKRRTAKYGKKEWAQMKAELAALLNEVGDAMKAATTPTDPRALGLAERHRQHISKWFYDCSYEIHRGLGELYVTDERFTRSIDGDHPGRAAWLRDAIFANAARSTESHTTH